MLDKLLVATAAEAGAEVRGLMRAPAEDGAQGRQDLGVAQDVGGHEEPARLLELISPAGFENYFREMPPLPAATERDRAAIDQVVAVSSRSQGSDSHTDTPRQPAATT